MATLQETGLSENIGIHIDTPPANALPVALFHFNSYGFGDLHHLHDRQAIAFQITDTEGLRPDADHLKLPKPWRMNSYFTLPKKLYGRPLFEDEFVLFDTPMGLTQAMVLDQSPEVECLEDLDLLINSHVRGEPWEPSVAVLGEHAIAGLLASSLRVLDPKGEGTDPFDESVFPLSRNDFLAMKFIQFADMCNVNIKRHIPVAHLEMMLGTMIVTTLVRSYYCLNKPEHIGKINDHWRFSFERFARAYGIATGEVADVMTMLNDEIYQAVRVKSPDIEPMEEGTFRLAAEFLCGERDSVSSSYF